MTKSTLAAEKTSAGALAEPNVQLPAVATQTFTKKGDLVNRDEFTEEQKAQVAEMAAKFDVQNSSAVLRFGAATQKRASSYMDELIDTMKVGEAGVAGDVLTEITTGVNMLRLKNVQEQLQKPRSWWQKMLGYTDFVKAFIDGHRSVVSKFEQIEKQAQNMMSTLAADSDKLDDLVDSTIVQVSELRVLIAVGEDVLERANADYAQKVEIALAKDPRDSLELQQLQDYLDSIRSFEVRLLRIKTAFVESSTVVIREIRTAQRSIKVEIQHLDEAVLFDITTFKRVVIQLGAQKNLQDAQAVRKGHSESVSELRDILGETTAANHAAAIASQGDALRQAQEVMELSQKVIASGQEALQLEEKAAAERKEAAALLEKTKLDWDTASADLAEKSVQAA